MKTLVSRKGIRGFDRNDLANRFRDAVHQRFPDSSSSIQEATRFVQACLQVTG